jgi:opacity protein-like surface antigen
MGKFTALSLAGLLTAAAFGPALAADLLPPPPPVEAPPPVADMSGWYLRGDVGVAINQMSNLRSTLQPTNMLGGAAPGITTAYSDIGDSAIIGIGAGYQFNNWFRADATLEYRSSAAYRKGMTYTAFCANPFCLDTYTANVSTAAFMLNGYVDLGTWAGVTPYVGAGVGFANHRMKNLTDVGAGLGYAGDSSKTNFAWALMAGLGYNVTQNLKLDMGYRYMDMGTVGSNPIVCEAVSGCFFEVQSYKATSHDFRLGFRYTLGEMASAPVMASNAPIFGGRPGPLVRKY